MEAEFGFDWLMLHNPLIFTDLDGTLLDHFTYSFSAVSDLLKDLSARRIPVIPVTSKTKSEVIAVRASLDNAFPFIVENGAAAFLPKDRFPICPEGGEPSGDYWQTRYSRLAARFRTGPLRRGDSGRMN